MACQAEPNIAKQKRYKGIKRMSVCRAKKKGKEGLIYIDGSNYLIIRV